MSRTRLATVGLALAWACGGGSGTPGTDSLPDIVYDWGPGDAGDAPGEHASDPANLDEAGVPPDDSGGRDLAEDTRTPSDDGGPEDPGESSDADLPGDADGIVLCPDDGLVCTDVFRDDGGACVTVLQPGFCLIGGACWFAYQPDPEHPCLFCVPDLDPRAFGPFEGLPCDDGEPCTAGDTCGPAGECRPGDPTDCNDLNACTLEWCEPGEGCRYQPYDSVCDDQDACTYQDHCEQGRCVGLKLPCKDTNPCTDDGCDPASGCVFPFNEADCDDGDACTEGDRCSQGTCAGTPADCDDGDPCSLDSCLPSFGCHHEWHYGSCDDGNACTVNDHCNASHQCVGYQASCYDGNPCTDDTCDPDVGCVYLPNDDFCDDGDPCTIDDRCNEGTCRGAPKDCEDGNWCTVDTCDGQGCHHAPTTGSCDDHDACTEGDTCATGQCVGVPRDCNDHNPCTSDSCDPAKGCVHTPAASLCDDGDPCTIGDHCEVTQCVGTPKNCADADPCTLDACTDPGVCTHTPHSGPCDDGDACTVNDVCTGGVCAGEPRDCDDQNPCTVDGCNSTWGCVHSPGEPMPCDDHSVCTTGDHCADGTCQGTPVSCHDGNLCTRDECDPVGGCVFVPFEGACDDGNACTVDDRCAGGTCSGTSLFTGTAAKSATLAIGVSGNPGQGLDVDDNPATCAPKGSCVKGIDNTFATLSWLFNAEVTKAVAAGTFALLLEWRATPGDGTTGDLNLYYGERHPGAACDPAAPGCLWAVYPTMISGTCQPLYGFEDAVLDGNLLTGGGPQGLVPLYLVFGDLRILVLIEAARIEVTLSLSGGDTLGQGVLAGGLDQQSLIAALQAAPADRFPPPYTRDLVVQYVTLYLQPDLDLDHDGSAESVSVGLPFTLVSGQIIGPL